MKIKKFIAPTLKEATEKMKAGLGQNAVILSTRIIEEERGNTVVKLFELTSGFEESSVTPKSKITLEEQPTAPANNNFAAELNLLQQLEKDKIKAKIDSKKKETLARNVTLKAQANKGKQIVNDLKEVISVLMHREIQKPYIKVIMDQLKKSKDLLTPSNLDNYVVECLSSMIPTTDFELTKSRKAKIVALVGPTGVGKTTSIAKLAAISKILHNLDVGIISIDTYRLGAIDQLRIFSEISNIDMLVAYEPNDLPELVAKLKHKDLIFIDTVGRSQKNAGELKNIKTFLDKVKVDHKFLVLNSTSSTKSLLDAAERFRVLDYSSFMFTKVDEAVAHGNLLNVSMKYEKPIIFLTNGQVIPDDIFSADSEQLARMIYTGRGG